MQQLFWGGREVRRGGRIRDEAVFLLFGKGWCFGWLLDLFGLLWGFVVVVLFFIRALLWFKISGHQVRNLL